MTRATCRRSCSSSGKSAIRSAGWSDDLIKRGVMTADGIEEMQQRINAKSTKPSHGRKGSLSRTGRLPARVSTRTVIMALTTYVEAIRQGIWEEMERDESVFVLGEDVGIYGGAFKVTDGMLEHFGERRVVDTPISESGNCRRRDRRGADGHAADRGNAVRRLHLLRLRPDHELRGQVPLSLGRGGPDRDPRAERRRHSRRTVSFAESGNVFRAHAGTEGGVPVDRLRRQGPDQVSHSRSRSGALLRAQVSLSANQGRASGGRLHGADRQGHYPRKGRDISVITYGAMVYIALDAAKNWRRKASIWKSSICDRCCRSTRKPFWNP